MMRISSFIVGGVVGMMGAMYVMKRKPEMAQVLGSVMSGVKKNIFKQSASGMTANANSASASSSQSNQSKQTNGNSANKNSASNATSVHTKQKNESDQTLIRSIIESDPQLQSQLEEITKESSSVKH